MKLSFAVLLAVANKWRGVTVDVFAARKVEELRNELLPQGNVGGISSLTERGEPYGDLTGKLRLDLAAYNCPQFHAPAPQNAGVHREYQALPSYLLDQRCAFLDQYMMRRPYPCRHTESGHF